MSQPHVVIVVKSKRTLKCTNQVGQAWSGQIRTYMKFSTAIAISCQIRSPFLSRCGSRYIIWANYRLGAMRIRQESPATLKYILSSCVYMELLGLKYNLTLVHDILHFSQLLFYTDLPSSRFSNSSCYYT